MSTTLKHRYISRGLQACIMNYYKYMRDEKIGYDESAFLETLPLSLRTESEITLRQRFIHKIPLFRDVSDRFVTRSPLNWSCWYLHPEITFSRKGDRGDEMFLIISGEVEVLDEEKM